jgi:CheY-like chemotaxis protein
MAVVLVVDDDPANLLAIQAILKRGGFEVLAARSRRQALTACEQHKERIALVISDVILREPNGFSVAEAFRRQCAAPVLLISGSPLDLLVDRGFLRYSDIVPGSCEFLPKPFTAARLLAAVRPLLMSEQPATLVS